MNREHIRKILREESRLKTHIKNYVDKFGLYQTSKMMGISKTDVVELGDIQINDTVAYEILSENFLDKKLTSRYKEFIISFDDSTGTFAWFSSTIKTGHFSPNYIEIISAYATPYWGGDDRTPVELTWFKLLDENGTRKLSQDIDGVIGDFSNPISFENTKELFTWYKEEYLPQVHDMIMNELLPQTHIIIDDLTNIVDYG
jgi:hypothetical protein